MGTVLHRVGQIIGGILAIGGGLGIRFLRAFVEESYGFPEGTPIPIPLVLDGGAYLLIGGGGLLAIYAVLGLLYTIIRSGGDEDQPRQPPEQQPRQPQQGQQPAQGQPRQTGQRQRPRSQEGQPRGQPQQGRQPVDDDRDRR
jgi:hypothetical protein